jgi:hypothetical protein
MNAHLINFSVYLLRVRNLDPKLVVQRDARLVAGFPLRRSGFEPRSGHVGFVEGKVALRQVFSEYFGFPCQSSYHRLLHNHPHLSSGAGTIGQ